MERRSFVSLLAAGAVALPDLGAQEQGLANLRKQHPRLILTEADLERLKELAAAPKSPESRVSGMIYRLRSHAERLLKEDPVRYELIGPRLLTQSRRCVDRVYAFAAMYLLDGSPLWLQGVQRNIHAAAQFPDWNPSHFLDVAEMTHAFAIAYDWLYDALPDADKRLIRESIVQKGLKPGFATGYHKDGPGKPGGWANTEHNWNQVCNGGMLLGALAIAEDEPQLARDVLAAARASLPHAMKSFAPDGGWVEGVAYWKYTLRYTVPLLAALDSALGTSFGIDQAPGFAETGDFYLHATGPTRLYFNFSDCARQRDTGFPWLHWMARRFDRPVWHWAASENASGEHPLSLLWYEPNAPNPKASRIPLERTYFGIHAAMMRSSWDSPQASYAGFFAGHNGANHSHLEMGSFVFDALGERWVEELGPDDYDLPGYFSKDQRWNYYRLNSQGQNVTLFGGRNQLSPARGRITTTGANKESAHAIADLTEGYSDVAESMRRGIRLMEGRKVLIIQDEFRLKGPETYEFQMHTMAEVKIDVDRAYLGIGNRMVELRALSRHPVEIVLQDPHGKTLAGGGSKLENPNNDYRKIVVRSLKPAAQGTVAVVLHPLENPNAPRGAKFVRPLDAWD